MRTRRTSIVWWIWKICVWRLCSWRSPALTTDEKIDEASQKIRRFAVDLDPYFIERPSEGKEILHSTATLAAERRKRPRQ